MSEIQLFQFGKHKRDSLFTWLYCYHHANGDLLAS